MKGSKKMSKNVYVVTILNETTGKGTNFSITTNRLESMLHAFEQICKEFFAQEAEPEKKS